VTREFLDGVSEWFGLRWDSALVDYTMGSTLWAQTSDEEGDRDAAGLAAARGAQRAGYWSVPA
jgi:hypothetical protein